MALKGYEFEPKQISLENFNPEGRILDLFGGEEMIGLLGHHDPTRRAPALSGISARQLNPNQRQQRFNIDPLVSMG